MGLWLRCGYSDALTCGPARSAVSFAGPEPPQRDQVHQGEQFIAKFVLGFDEQEPHSPAVSVVVVFAASVLVGIPSALRAARVNPVDTLRCE
ncbi:MAG TPA: hypothetical protein VFT41_13860 [Gemmatimonadaceae bacterium]|nr:hypothetical protein [Gemmatimonadaceae bacterium]